MHRSARRASISASTPLPYCAPSREAVVRGKPVNERAKADTLHDAFDGHVAPHVRS